MEAELKKNIWAGLAVVLVLGAVSFVCADDVISPFVDSQTNGVIYVDFSAIDMDQLDAWHEKMVTTIPDDGQRAQQVKDMKESLGKMRKWAGDFKAAGGKDLYVVISLSGIMSGSPGGVVVPLNGSDGTALAKVFPQPPAAPAGMPADGAAQWARMQPATAVVGNVMVFSTGAGVDRMKTASTEPRPDLTDALAAGNGGAMRIAVSPSTLKNNPFFAMMMAQMNRAASAQGLPPASPLSDPVWDGVTWVSLSVSAPPKESGSLTIQCKDADSAGAMSSWISQQVAEGKAQNAPSQMGVSADDYDRLAAVMKPAVRGTQVVISVDQDAIDNVIGPIFIKSMASTMQPGVANTNTPATEPVGGGL